MNLIAAMGFFLVLRASMVKRKGEQTMGVGFDTCMKNSFWKGIYDNAPSDEVKEYYRIMFDTCSQASSGGRSSIRGTGKGNADDGGEPERKICRR